MKKKIFLILTVIFLLFVVGTFSIFSDNRFLNQIELLIPPKLKIALKNTIFFIPATIKNNEILKRQYGQLEFEKKKNI